MDWMWVFISTVPRQESEATELARLDPKHTWVFASDPHLTSVRHLLQKQGIHVVSAGVCTKNTPLHVTCPNRWCSWTRGADVHLRAGAEQ